MLKINDIQKIINSDLYTIVSEPEHSTNRIKELRTKYKISDEDWSEFMWNLEFFIQCEGKVDDLN